MSRRIGLALIVTAVLAACSSLSEDEYQADVLAACQDNYIRLHTLADEARQAAAVRKQEDAKKYLEQWLSETRKFAVCYFEAKVQKQIADVERGLRPGGLVVPPPAVGIA